MWLFIRYTEFSFSENNIVMFSLLKLAKESIPWLEFYYLSLSWDVSKSDFIVLNWIGELWDTSSRI